MKTLIQAAFSHARTVISLLIFFMISGFVSYLSIPKESMPDVQLPIIYVSLFHEGISPADAERLLVRPMEQQLRSIEDVKEMTSTAFEGGAYVFLEFRAGLDSAKALADVRAKVDDAKADFPPETDEPVVNEINLSLFPVLVVTLSGDIPKRTLYAQAESLRDHIEENVSSVLDVNIVGTQEEVIEVIVDPFKLEGYALSLEDFTNFMRVNNRLIPAGNIDTGRGAISIKIPGIVEDIDALHNMPLKVHKGALVRFSDVAKVQRTYKDPIGYARDFGRPAVALEIIKRTGENIIDTNKAVKDAVRTFTHDWPDSLKISYSQDESGRILEVVSDLQNNLILAVTLVMIVIVSTLGWRSAVLVGLSIPGAFLLGIYVIGLMGVTLNIIVLFSLILAVGLLVDGAVIVVEFADRQMGEGRSKQDAYQLAVQRMAWPVITSIITTVLVFLPLLLWPGVIGQVMKYLPLTLTVTLAASILMGLIFVPTLGSIFGKPAPLGKRITHVGKEGSLENLKGWIGRYVALLDELLDHPLKVIMGTILLLVAIFKIYSWFGVGVSFFPDIEPPTAAIEISARGDMSVAEKDQLVRQVESRILDMKEFAAFYTSTAFGGSQRPRGERPQDIIGVITVEFVDWEKRRTAEKILAEVLERTQDIPGIRVGIRKNKPGPATAKPIQVQLSSQNYENLERSVEKVRSYIESMEGVQNIEDTRPLPGIDWRVNVDRAQAAKLDANITVIGKTIMLLTSGYKIDEFLPDDSREKVDIVLRYPKEYRTLDYLKRLRVRTKSGLVPIDSFVKVEPQPQVSQIKRVNGKRSFVIKADVESGVLADDKVREIRQWLEKEGLGTDISWQFKGEEADKQETSAFLMRAFLLALFLITIVLVTQFNSFFSTLLVLSSIVMSFIGVLIGLLVTNQPFIMVMGGVGTIALAGLIVSNNIILIDTFDVLTKETDDKREAILRTGAQRLRPVVLTQITTILALLPILFGVTINFLELSVSYGAPSTQWWIQLSTVITFGILFASPLTLIVTPCALMARENYRVWKRKHQDQLTARLRQNLAHALKNLVDIVLRKVR